MSGVNPNAEQLVNLDWYDSSLEESRRTCHAAITGIAQGGAVCGLVTPPLVFGSLGILDAMYRGDWSYVDTVFVRIFGGMCVGIFLGPIVALLASVPAILLVVLFNKTLGYSLIAKTQIGLVGGLAGFLAVSLFVVQPVMPLLLGALAILITVACGHFSAMLWAQQPMAWKYSKKVAVEQINARGNQFQIKHLFALTAWVAIVFAIDRLTQTRLAICVGIYSLFQIPLFWFSKLRYRRIAVKEKKQLAGPNGSQS